MSMFLLPILTKLAHHPLKILQILLFGIATYFLSLLIWSLGLGKDVWGYGLVLVIHEVGLLLLVLEDLFVELLLDLCVLLLFL